MKKNLFFWYPFKENTSILEIAQEEEKMLEEENVINMQPDNCNLEQSDEKYDYVVLYEPNLLENAIKYLKPDGTILLATNNRFAISYFAGASYNRKNL